jgi:hypothetical protein
VYLAQASRETALGDVPEGLEAELRDHELLPREELGRELGEESMFDGLARQAELAVLGRGEMPCYSVENLRRDLDETAGLGDFTGRQRHGAPVGAIGREEVYVDMERDLGGLRGDEGEAVAVGASAVEGRRRVHR